MSLQEPVLLGVEKEYSCYGDSQCMSTIMYTAPNGRYKETTFRNKDWWTNRQAELWLKGKYHPRVSNLFGLLFYI